MGTRTAWRKDSGEAKKADLVLFGVELWSSKNGAPLIRACSVFKSRVSEAAETFDNGMNSPDRRSCNFAIINNVLSDGCISSGSEKLNRFEKAVNKSPF